MAGREEEEERWTMRPCTAVRSTMAGDHGPATRVVSKSKRGKAVARSSRKKGERRPECAAAGAGDRALPDPHGKAAMPTKKVVGAAAAAQAGGKGKRPLKKSEIRTIIALKPEPFPEDDYLDGMAKYYPPEWLEQKKREHAQDAAYFGKIDADYEDFRKKVIDGVKEKGYFEVDEGYMEKKPDQHPKPQLQKVDLSELMRFAATPEEELRRRGGNGYHEYSTDEEDDAVLAHVRDEDDDDDFLSDSSVSDEENAQTEGADVHKVAAIVAS
ncbi:hypothetical protein CFC21_106765 [Triticum aestivum]|uniref:Uncharacterized protein n=5 Tax=Triticinae TaxID=1648030 RepID=A0A453QG56_AEGTS|nr:uncharacterized protein LOC123167331 [Triticum aestivum]KAF7106001.1 hypothetical protein CFC21_106765 [Triticum aestivum]